MVSLLIFKKITGVLLVTVLLAYSGFQTYFIMAQTPTQPYRLVKKSGEMEIRFYPSAIEASVQKNGEYKQMMNNGFRDLAGYIFGGNEEKQKIAMTAPVKSVLDEKGSGEITFVMPEGFKLESKPKPNASHIQFRETEPVYTASLTFGGFANKEKMGRKSEALLELLKKEGLSPSGNVQYLYYNPPFQLFGRKNEVLVELTGFQE